MIGLEYNDAAHLLRRMGFGGSPDEINSLASKGRDGAVDYLLNYQSIDNSEMERILAESFEFPTSDDQKLLNQREISTWWITRMVYTKRPFEEKLTLFWHHHFATALSKVKDFLMYVQNLTLRQYALSRFDELVLKVSQDPAMLIWLDGVVNVKGAPNENFARELQELFTLGIKDVVTGAENYTEQDVKEIARAFTGWEFKKKKDTSIYTYESVVDASQHDNTAKTIYGQTANFSGEDVITIIANRRPTGRYLVYKLFNFFVYPLDLNSSADKALIDKFADVYFSTNHSMKELLRAIFTSDEFFSNRARFALIKTPIELVVGAVRMLQATYKPGTQEKGDREQQLFRRAGYMGMELYNPPDVNGWDLHLGWVSTATMLERFNFANMLITERPKEKAVDSVSVSLEQLKANTKPSVKKTVSKFLEILGPLEVSSSAVKQLRKYLTLDDQGNAVAWVVTDDVVDKKVRGLVHQIMCLPEFNLN